MSEKYEITGRVIHIGESQTFSSGFTKREFVLETLEEKYNQQIPFELLKDATSKIDAYRVGDILTASFNLKGREHNGRWYPSLQAWKLEGQGSGGQSKSRSPNQNTAPPPSRDTSDDEGFDSIPF